MVGRSTFEGNWVYAVPFIPEYLQILDLHAPQGGKRGKFDVSRHGVLSGS